MFIDQVQIHCRAGDGGDGCLSFRREAHVAYGGPDGGDGGKGGDVIIEADENMGSLYHLVGHRHWKAPDGQRGQGKQRTGKGGDDKVIRVPTGTIIKDAADGHLLKDLVAHGDQFVVAAGGKGGRGNKRFATSTDRAPRHFEKGGEGGEREVVLELKLIADVGLIGKPNAGKSTLLSRLSRATPEIADYPFTTKYPHLGAVRVGYQQQFVLADIPGLIEGAHAGIGLGHEFLKHVQRTRVLVHLIEPNPADQSDPTENYRQIREEMRLFDPSLVERPELVVVSKCELPDAQVCAELFTEETGIPVRQISSATGAGLPDLIKDVMQLLEEEREAAAIKAAETPEALE
ncbi:MAG: GTPase ObgE [Planctomycetaceae bacterium]